MQQPHRPMTPRAVYSPIPPTPGSPAYEKESHMGNDHAARQQVEASDQRLKAYEEEQARLTTGIESSMYLLGELRNFNRGQWPVRYPHIRSDGPDPALPQRPGMARRTLTFADEPAASHDVVVNTAPSARRALKRSLTLAPAAPLNTITTESLPSTSAAAAAAAAAAPATSRPQASQDSFAILGLDQLSTGMAKHAQGLISHLEKTSIASLLDNKFGASLDHLALLRQRVQDPQSRVLITGDLNAGKSTLINALLRRHEVMPTDQQPLTTRFVEVVSAKENGGKEEIHVLDQAGKYDPADQSTYTLENIEHLEILATDAETDASAPPIRVFLDEAAPDLANPSILHNGVVDISLIDAPGLNRDSIKTTANFARQEEIDVVVFVVSAANHFTLSAKEFIWQAGHEKAHLFIVVNRFDQIRDKERCRRAVLEQIRQLSPSTYEDAADLVHFVDSAKVALGCSEEDSTADDLDQAFCHLEHSLRSFVLVNRAKSKLGPAQNYVTHLLADVELLASANELVAGQERDAARAELDRVKPVLEQMKKGKEGLEESLVAEEEAATETASSRTRGEMQRALERVARGELAGPAPGLEFPAYTGILGAWDYARDVKRVFLASLDWVAGQAEDDARKITSDGVQRVDELGDKYLPADVERQRRVLNTAAMFSARPPTKGKAPLSRRASGINTLGLGLAARPQLADVAFTDMFDLAHHISLARSSLPSAPSSSSSSSSSSSMSQALTLPGFAAEMGGVGIASLALGALSLGGKLYSAQSLIEGAIRVSDFAIHPLTRRWAGPAVLLVMVGAVGWVVYDLPASIPRTVGRRLELQLRDLQLDSHAATSTDNSDSNSSAPNSSYADVQAKRISDEVRKVMRLKGWEVREQFKGAVDVRGELVRACQDKERNAVRALVFCQSVGKQVEEIRGQVGIKV